jgi:2-polyprenyl-3-methyl-5-hydroxy-6-metoxy-1,4-benzoquinol methylase
LSTESRSSGDYPLGDSTAELARLERQAAFFADLTEDWLRRAGLVAGMRVLDIGCGAGDVSLLAARLVGPTGAVLGIDRSAEAVAWARQRAAQAGVAWAEFAAADLDKVEPLGTFNALIGRLILLYLPDRAAILRRLVARLQPEAIVAFQEMDMRAARAVPEGRLFRRCRDWIAAAFQLAGAEPDMGSRLFATFQQAGLPPPKMIAAGRVEGGPDSACYEQLAAILERLLPVLERSGLATAAEVGIATLALRLREEAAALQQCIVFPTLIGAWCRIAG